MMRGAPGGGGGGPRMPLTAGPLHYDKR